MLLVGVCCLVFVVCCLLFVVLCRLSSFVVLLFCCYLAFGVLVFGVRCLVFVVCCGLLLSVRRFVFVDVSSCRRFFVCVFV